MYCSVGCLEDEQAADVAFLCRRFSVSSSVARVFQLKSSSKNSESDKSLLFVLQIVGASVVLTHISRERHVRISDNTKKRSTNDQENWECCTPLAKSGSYRQLSEQQKPSDSDHRQAEIGPDSYPKPFSSRAQHIHQSRCVRWSCLQPYWT